MAVPSSVRERVVWEVHRQSTAGLTAIDLLARAAQSLHRAVPFDLYSAAMIDPASNLITRAFGGLPDGVYHPGKVNLTYFEHFYFQEGFLRTGELLGRRTWATTLSDHTGGKLDLSLCYRDALRPAGLHDKLHALFVDGVLWGDMELYRAVDSPPFRPEELDLVRRVAPVIGAGLKAAALQQRGAADLIEAVPGVVVLDHRRRVVSATPAAERLLRELGALAPNWQASTGLPVVLQVVCGALDETLAAGPGADMLGTPRVQVQSQSGRWLSLQASRAEPVAREPAATVVVISPARSEDLAWLSLVAFGLSPREEEVVKLVVGGLSTKQISDRLFIAEHTVQRHLSNIFEKVGVRNRRALVKELFFEQLIPAM